MSDGVTERHRDGEKDRDRDTAVQEALLVVRDIDGPLTSLVRRLGSSLAWVDLV